MPIIKKSIELQAVCCIYAILLLSAALYAGAPFGPDGSYTWGIGNDQLTIPIGSVITKARLTLHKPVFNQNPTQGVVYIHLLDNPDPAMTDYVDGQTGDYFDGYGVYLARFDASTLLSNPSEITIELDKIIRPVSVPVGPVPVTYRSAIPELLDYAGTGRSFGFGIDCDGFKFDALTLVLTVQSMTTPTLKNDLVFTIQNPNRPPAATWDSYTFTQNDPAQTLFVLTNDSDPDGDSLSISAIRPPLHGQAEIVENNTAVRYTPAAGYNGTDVVVYTISDGNGGTATSAAFITVQAAYTVTLTAKNGKITKSPDKTAYVYGEVVTLTAAANPGYLFTGWFGNASGMVNPKSITVTKDMSIGGNFWPILW